MNDEQENWPFGQYIQSAALVTGIFAHSKKTDRFVCRNYYLKLDFSKEPKLYKLWKNPSKQRR
jgi:hypothetical protein